MKICNMCVCDCNSVLIEIELNIAVNGLSHEKNHTTYNLCSIECLEEFNELIEGWVNTIKKGA